MQESNLRAVCHITLFVLLYDFIMYILSFKRVSYQVVRVKI